MTSVLCLMSLILLTVHIPTAPARNSSPQDLLRQAQILADSSRFAEAESISVYVVRHPSNTSMTAEQLSIAACLAEIAHFSAGYAPSAERESLAWTAYRQLKIRRRPASLSLAVAAEAIACIQADHDSLGQAVAYDKEALTHLTGASAEARYLRLRILSQMASFNLDLEPDHHVEAEAELLEARALAASWPHTPRREAAHINGELGFAALECSHLMVAVAAFSRALGLAETQSKLDTMMIAQWLIGRGEAFADSGLVTEASNDYREAAHLRLLAHGPASIAYAKALDRLGHILDRADSMNSARDTLERAVQILSAAGVPGRKACAMAQLDLGDLYQEMGECARAIELYQSSSDTLMSPIVGDTANAANCLNDWAALLLDNLQLRDSKAKLTESIALQTASTASDKNALANTWQNLALAFRQLQRPDSARICFRLARQLRLSADRIDFVQLAKLHNNLGLLASDEEAFRLAHAEYDSARTILASWLPATDPSRLEVEKGLSEVEWVEGNPEKAFRRALTCESDSRRHIAEILPVLSEREGVLLTGTRVGGLDVALSIALERQDASMISEGWDALIRSRGVVFDAVVGRHRTAASWGDSLTRGLWAEVTMARRERATLFARKPSGLGASEYRSLLRQATHNVEKLEARLAERDPLERQRLARRQIGLGEVREGLPDKAALVGICRFMRYDPNGVRAHRRAGEAPRVADAGIRNALDPLPWYAAFVLNGPRSVPAMIDLGAAGRLDSLVSAWLEAASGRSGPEGVTCAGVEAAYRATAGAVKKATWDLIAPALQGVHTLYTVPDGSLHMLAFETLPSDDGGYLVETMPLLVRLPAERDVVAPEAPAQHGDGYLGVGDVDYEHTDIAPLGNRVVTRADSTQLFFRGALADCFDPSLLTDLTWAGREADDAARLWRQHARSNGLCDVLTGATATESLFRLLARGRQILHIATHGFAVGPGCAGRESPREGAGFANGCRDPFDMPIFESALAFAGAAHTRSDTKESDGLLTAEEVATLALMRQKLTPLEPIGRRSTRTAA